MYNILMNIFTLGLKPLYDKHLQYYLIVKEFSEKLPRSQNQARPLSDEKKRSLLGNSGSYITAIDLSTQKVSISESDLDVFYNKLNQFDYSFILFKKYYQSYTENLNRLQPKAENRDFGIAVVQFVLNNPIKPLKPISVLLYHLKYKYTLTSKIYVWWIQKARQQ